MNLLLDRFLRYVRLDTKADENSSTYPSTEKQLVLSRLLYEECRQLGLQDVSIDDFGIVMATVPAPVSGAPTICLCSHVDTSPEFTSTNVNPIVHERYSGGDITLSGDPTRVIRESENPDLKTVIGHALITTDGTTLLGADDKAGLAVIMTCAAELMKNRQRQHSGVRLCFTCDEEIGHGTDHLDLKKIGAICGYTLDGDGVGKIDSETFSADQAIVTVTGINTHPSIGYGSMVNAVRILSAFIDRLPNSRLSPETSRDREGFIHPYSIEGGVAEAKARLILRDFETPALHEQAKLLRTIANTLEQEFPRAKIEITIKEQYRNMREGLVKEPRALTKAEEAFRAIGIEPRRTIVRGGTDGSMLTAKGLPTPNLSTGQHNPHSPLEWASLNEMETAVQMLVALAEEWAKH